MTLIEILINHLRSTTAVDKENLIQLYCPYEFDIFREYIQGKKEYCNINGCDECWHGKPLKRIVK